MNKIYLLFTSFIFFLTSVSVSAQEPENKKEEQEAINRQMILEREYAPTVMDAQKINTLPKVRELDIQKRPIVYSDYALPLRLGNEINALPAGTFMTGIDRYANNGYLHFGAGMLMNFSGDFGYHLLSTERDDLGIHFSHRSSNGKVKFLENIYGNEILDETYKSKAMLNDNIGGLDFKHAFDNLTLSIGGSAGYSMFNYYGLPPVNSSSFMSSLPQNLFIPTDSATNQGNRTINIYAGIASGIRENLGYHLGIDYTNFDQKYALSKDYKGITENSFALDFGLNSPFKNDQCFGIDLKLNILSYTAPELPTNFEADSINFDNRYELTFSPYYKLDRESLKLLLGINLMAVFQEETDFFVSPNIKLDVPFSTSSIFYVDLGGGIESNTLSQISRINRYVNPEFMPDASRSWVDGRLGVRSSITSGFWIDIFGGYKYTESDVFFNPSMLGGMKYGFNNVSMIFQPNTQRLQVGASLKYDYKSVFGFYLKGTYNNYTVKHNETWKNRVTGIPNSATDEIEPYGKPALVINAGINVKPTAPLTLNLDYSMLSGMYVYYYGENLTCENLTMKTINDLYLRGSWQFNNTFSVYAQFNNLLFQKQEMFYGYPLQPFTAMAGLNINF
ncbi:MAG: TonB-dependent receptor [Tannerella sp.]|nr:TonB-dependent receptor [Tannerella sp.]